jgi:hypothetical protein
MGHGAKGMGAKHYRGRRKLLTPAEFNVIDEVRFDVEL